MVLFSGLIERVAALQDGFVEARVALFWGNESDGAVSMVVVVPMHELLDPSLCLADVGKGFDPAQIQQEELESLIAKRKDGGLGMRLIKTLMDEVQYEIGPGQKNELRMTKRIRKS